MFDRARFFEKNPQQVKMTKNGQKWPQNRVFELLLFGFLKKFLFGQMYHFLGPKMTHFHNSGSALRTFFKILNNEMGYDRLAPKIYLKILLVVFR